MLKHLRVLKEMVRIDSRSFSVNEFEGDRKTPSDMKEILACASNYLRQIGFKKIKINTPPESCLNATPILLAELVVSSNKPTLLFYAHLDKQPYMDDDKFEKWGGIAPTELTWNQDKTRAYGRGAADDLSGVISIGMAIDALLRAIESDPENLSKNKLQALPCNIKILYETEEECGSHSLAEQISQNQSFFNDVDCVVITDVINPATGYPGLTTSLRGITQLEVSVDASATAKLDAQTALYKLLATLIREDHSLAIDAIAKADIPVTKEEQTGFSYVPTTVKIKSNEMSSESVLILLRVILRLKGLVFLKNSKSFNCRASESEHELKQIRAPARPKIMLPATRCPGRTLIVDFLSCASNIDVTSAGTVR